METTKKVKSSWIPDNSTKKSLLWVAAFLLVILITAISHLGVIYLPDFILDMNHPHLIITLILFIIAFIIAYALRFIEIHKLIQLKRTNIKEYNIALKNTYIESHKDLIYAILFAMSIVSLFWQMFYEAYSNDNNTKYSIFDIVKFEWNSIKLKECYFYELEKLDNKIYSWKVCLIANYNKDKNYHNTFEWLNNDINKNIPFHNAWLSLYNYEKLHKNMIKYLNENKDKVKNWKIVFMNNDNSLVIDATELKAVDNVENKAF